jgi:hypothetical protein
LALWREMVWWEILCDESHSSSSRRQAGMYRRGQPPTQPAVEITSSENERLGSSLSLSL